MIRLVRLFGTSIGQKMVVAVTGALLLGFLIGHMLGNMAVFQGQDSMNGYAAWLQGHPLLWFMRLGLLAIFVLHIFTTLRIALQNRGARGTNYKAGGARNAGFASRYMVLTGLLVLSFVVYHLLHFTFGAVQPDSYGMLDPLQRHDVYSMVVRGFQNPLVAGSYVVSMLLLGIHLMHGAASIFQTFGINHESYDVMIRYGTFGLVALIVVGNCSIPILILAGAVPLAGGN
jgi:succinate dehydrogenase / fumarate reductase cytochrome b subunit